jgi:hypothetical protein
MLGHVRLSEHDRLLGIDTFGNQQRGNFAYLVFQYSRVLRNRNGVQVYNAENILVFILLGSPVFRGSQIVADMNITCRLYARKHTFFH